MEQDNDRRPRCRKRLVCASSIRAASARCLLGDPYDLAGGPPVKAMIVQNTNPASVAPDQTKVKQGLAREDLVRLRA